LRRNVPVILTTVTAVIVFFSIVLFKTADVWPGRFDRMQQFMAAVMMFMGMANMTRVHGNVVLKKTETGYSQRGSCWLCTSTPSSE